MRNGCLLCRMTDVKQVGHKKCIKAEQTWICPSTSLWWPHRLWEEKGLIWAWLEGFNAD